LAQEIALFWFVLAGFLLVDNLVLVPRGGDFLNFGLSGRLRYDPGVRLEALRRDVVLLNPLNPFDRIALTSRVAGDLTAEQLRTARRMVRSSLAPLNRLSWMGMSYLVGLVALLASSWSLPFGIVLTALAALHVCSWLFGTLVTIFFRTDLHLSNSRVASLITEALFVPAYTVNLSKRIWYRQRLDMPAMSFGLRALKHMPDDAVREVYGFRMSRRLEALAQEWEGSAEPFDEKLVPSTRLARWVQKARACLTALAPSTGS
jgi:hypothetical protein